MKTVVKANMFMSGLDWSLSVWFDTTGSEKEGRQVQCLCGRKYVEVGG